MKYFVDDEHWDVIGYVKELKKLLPRFNKETSIFLKTIHFMMVRLFPFTALIKKMEEQRIRLQLK